MLVGKDDILDAFRLNMWGVNYRGIQYDYLKLNIGPNSIDVSLHPRILEMGVSEGYDAIDPFDTASYSIRRDIVLNEDKIDRFKLVPGKLYLGATNESFVSKSLGVNSPGWGHRCIVPQYEGRSTCARIGLTSHLSAGFGDHGFQSAFTLEITVVYPTYVYANMRIGQVYFTMVTDISDDNIYTGAYAGQNHNDGPVPPVLGKARF